MFKIVREEVEWGGRKLVLETGKMARQADGAVLATYGETTVLATVVALKEPKPGQDFFPDHRAHLVRERLLLREAVRVQADNAGRVGRVPGRSGDVDGKAR